MIRNVNTDLTAGIIGAVVAGLFWFTLDTEMGWLSSIFPKAMIQIMALISILLIVKGLVRPERRNLFAEGSNRRVLVVALHFFAWGIAIPHLGFFVSSVVVISSLVYYLALVTHTVTLRRVAGWFAIVLAEVTFFYLIFTELLHIPLPRGWLM